MTPDQSCYANDALTALVNSLPMVDERTDVDVLLVKLDIARARLSELITFIEGT